jgi:hypothetical protein
MKNFFGIYGRCQLDFDLLRLLNPKALIEKRMTLEEELEKERTYGIFHGISIPNSS